MDKKYLRSIERPKADGKILRFAGRNKDRADMIVQIRDVGKEILQMAFFKVSDLMKGKPDAALRIFFSEDDYITQDLTTVKTKWKTGKLDYVAGDGHWYTWHPYAGRKCKTALVADPMSWKLLIDRFGKPEKQEYWWREVLEFQENILEIRLEIMRNREMALIDAEMEKVPDLPDDFDEWVEEEGLYPYRVMMYTPARRKTTQAYCTHCRQLMEIDVKKVHPHKDRTGFCPNCGSRVTFKTVNSSFSQYWSRWLCIIQPTEDGFVERYFSAIIKYNPGVIPLTLKPDIDCFELCRIMYQARPDGEYESKAYEWGVYKQRGSMRWCPDMDKWNCINAFTYTHNLPDALVGTPYQYCAVDHLQKHAGNELIPVFRFILNYPSYPFLEYFAKAGMTNLLRDLLRGWGTLCIDYQGRTPEQILMIPKAYIRILVKLNGGEGMLTLLKQYEADGILPDPEEVRRWNEMLEDDDETLGLVNAHRKQMSRMKFLNWLERQTDSGDRKSRTRYRDAVRDWKDYLFWSATLGKDMNDLYYLLPPHLKKAHDQALKEYKAREKKIMDEAVRKLNEELEAMRHSGMDAMHMEAGGLAIVIPRDDKDIVREGQIQHHCVGTYVERVARGETMILFIRKKEDLDKPYFTMEYRDGHVVQCRGFRNCSMPKNVEVFVKAFEKKMMDEHDLKERTRVRVRVS